MIRNKRTDKILREKSIPEASKRTITKREKEKLFAEWREQHIAAIKIAMQHNLPLGVAPPPKPDLVNSPPHYTQASIECIDAIAAALSEEEFRGFCKGNALKYIWRSELKGESTENIAKAIWYLQRLVSKKEPTK